jgi:hypothetical protein
MSARSVHQSEPHGTPAVRFGWGWRRLLGRARRARPRRESEPPTACFGRLREQDEMVLGGLTTSLACAREHPDGRS